MSSIKAFWDSSALVPLCVEEPNTDWATKLSKQFEIKVWWSTSVEVSSALERLYRMSVIDDSVRQSGIKRLTTLIAGWEEITPDQAVRDLARALLADHPLRAADSLQLAAALIWCQHETFNRRFICADIRLCAVASQLGFLVVQPA